ncbi:hypothetical protein LUZ61_010418 [Rhynchospora tenuis]|uniref:Uncharacterized protein n=1 Tax=Rhynchospora tenuis TaxID=198213 RepID=A0AAD5ZZ94_9POAL|nr:hypothetical protein LUZ61_010418 [Rhynchospora tenuis]
MASALRSVFSSLKHFVIALSLLSLFTPCLCIRANRRLDDGYSSGDSAWIDAVATWYGNPYGYGTDGCACGYADAVGKAPYSSMITSVGPSLYKEGRGCGACYMVRCSTHSLCSGSPVTVVVADVCPGCTENEFRFDMSGTAFGLMSKSFSADQFRNIGRISVQYKRIPCNYNDININFKVDAGSNPYYLAVLVLYEGGDGDISLLEVIPHPGAGWATMKPSWGAVWKYQADSSMPGPFSFRITTGTGKILIIENAIPAGWSPGQTYASSKNF